MNSKAISAQAPKAADAIATAAPKRVASESLLGEAKALLILHNGREYQLRLTQNGKLILTA
jgi:hemin uptake protein HemP